MVDDTFKDNTDQYILIWLIDANYKTFKELFDKFFQIKNKFPDKNVLKVKLFSMNEQKLISVDTNGAYQVTDKGWEEFNKEKLAATYNEIIIPNEEQEQIKEIINSWTSFTDLVKQFWKISPFFYDRSCLWWIWINKETRWRMVDEVDLLNCLDDVLENYQTTKGRIKSELLETMKRIGRLNIPDEVPVDTIQFKDKFFNIKTGKITQATPALFCTNPIPWRIGLSENTPTIDKLFKDWVGQEYVQTLYEIIAYCCLPDYPISLIFCLVGSGRNGKTKFQGLLGNFIGSDNLCSTELDTLLDSRFESAKLYRKLLCILGETNFGIIKKTSLLKKLVGQDVIGYEFKNKNPFDALNYAKVVINSNSLPTSDDTSDGFYRRWFIIDFPNQFPEGKDVLKIIPDVEYNNLCRKVINILPGLLEKGAFTNQGSIEERRQKYILSSNPLSIFIKAHCEVAETHEEKFSYFYQAYANYLKNTKKRVVSKKELSKLLSLEGYHTNFVRRSTDGQSVSFTAIHGLQVDNLFLEKQKKDVYVM